MKTKRVDGILFEKMIRNGLNCLHAEEKTLNAMNVFPVADGDTGTNMLTTLSNGIACAETTENLSDYLKALSSGMLLGARGNSGVILSQIFKGISLELTNRACANCVELRHAFIRGYKVAYESVIHPAEGTILTVAREGIDNTSKQSRSIRDVESLLEIYLAFMEISLKGTPELLPVLKEMGVLDSGGKGYIAVIQGMSDYLHGVIHPDCPVESAAQSASLSPAPAAVDLSRFNESSSFEEGYCTEFILQLLKDPAYDQTFDEAAFIRELGSRGDSLVVVRDGSRIKVHVHTKKPASIISLAQQYGEFLTFKLENMQLQHNEYLHQKQQEEAAKQPEPAKEEVRLPDVPRIQMPLAVIAAVNGYGNKKIFNDFGCEYVIECGVSMNASTADFLDMIRKADASHTVILPGNGNLILAAEQAASMSGVPVTVLPSKSIPESYFALAMDIPDSQDIPMRIGQMKEGIESIATLLITVSAKTFDHNGTTFKAHDWVALYKSEPVATSEDLIDIILQGMAHVDGIEDRETCVFFRGAGGSAAYESAIEKAVRQQYPLMEITFLDGGQTAYDWMIGLI